MAIEKVISIKADTGAATQNVTRLNNELKKTSEATKKSGADLSEVSKITDDFTGGAISKFEGLTKTLGGVSGAFRTVGSAVAASGLGLLVIVISSLVAAFKSSEAGEDKFARILGVIGQVTAKLIDTLAALGELIIDVFENPQKAIKDFANLIKENIVNRFTGLLELIPALGKAVKQLFTGDFSGAAKTAADAAGKVALGVENITDKINAAKNATKEYIKELERQAKIGAFIADQRDKAEDLERDLIVKRAEADRKIADLREKAVQKDTFSLKERIAFLTQASAIENKISAQEIEAAKLKRDAKILENKQTRSNTAALEEEEQLKAKVIQLDTARLQAQKTLTKGIQTLRAEANADLKAKTDEANKIITDGEKELAANLKKQKDANNALEKEVTDAISAAQDKNNESLISAQEVEKQAVKDKYFRLIELARQFGKDTKDLEIQKANELNDINLKYQAIDYANRKTQAEKDAEIEKNKNDVIAKSKENLTNIVSGLESTGLAKTKAGQLVSKAIALTQIGIDSAVAISKASTLANAEGVAAQLAFPTVPGIGTAARIISYISTGAQVASNIVRAKQLLSSGGGGSTGSSGGGGAPSRGGGGGGSAPPSFNIVGQNPNNQLAQSISQKQSQPIEAFVVSGNVSNAQSLDRNRITTATFN